MDKKQKTPEPTFKSDIDNMVSGVKKFNKKVNDTTKPVRKVLEKAAGKEEQGVIGQFTKPDTRYHEQRARVIGQLTTNQSLCIIYYDYTKENWFLLQMAQ